MGPGQARIGREDDPVYQRGQPLFSVRNAQSVDTCSSSSLGWQSSLVDVDLPQRVSVELHLVKAVMAMGTVPIETRAAGSTHVGLRRTNNEDAMLCDAPVYLVADGMGGYDAGELASAVAINAFAHLVGEDSVTVAQIRRAYTSAGESVIALGEGHARGAGTTLTGVAIMRHNNTGYWLVLNVGDSRAYRLRQGRLVQLTVDHSVVQELVAAGELSEREAATDSRRNVVTRALTADRISEPDMWMLPAKDGDRMLVCSDGLTGELPDHEIAHILADQPDPQVAANFLVQAAVARGGRDNVTVVVVDALAVERPEEPSYEDTAPRPLGVE